MEKVGNVLINVMQELSRISTNGSATVKINENLCRPREFEQLFDYFSRGTIIEHVDLDVKRMSAEARCGCGYREKIDGDHPGYKKCPQCGRFAEIDDSNYELVEPDPELVGERNSIRF